MGDLPEAIASGPTAPGAPDDVTLVIGSNRDATEAVRREADARGFRARIDGTGLRGEARLAGERIGRLVRAMRESDVPLESPACVVLGGETTVTVRGSGRGGRNQEVALAAALALDGLPRTAVLCFATDGIDGPTDAAGAQVTGETLERARAAGLSPERALAENDALSFFRALDDLWVTGPTGTNVNDVAIALLLP
jgi:hydroxypyruvate reductase